MYIVMYIIYIYICMYVYPNQQLTSPRNASTFETWHPALNEKLPQSHQAIEETVTRTASNSHLGALRFVWCQMGLSKLGQCQQICIQLRAHMYLYSIYIFCVCECISNSTYVLYICVQESLNRQKRLFQFLEAIFVTTSTHSSIYLNGGFSQSWCHRVVHTLPHASTRHLVPLGASAMLDSRHLQTCLRP